MKGGPTLAGVRASQVFRFSELLFLQNLIPEDSAQLGDFGFHVCPVVDDVAEIGVPCHGKQMNERFGDSGFRPKRRIVFGRQLPCR